MRRFSALVLFAAIAAHAQTPSDIALLTKTKALYDTPLRRGLVNFDCAVEFDFAQHLKDSFSVLPPNGLAMVDMLRPIHYRLFLDQSGSTVSPPKPLPDLSSVAHAAEIEESNRSLIQIALNNWEPHAAGVLLPLGPTKYHFEKTNNGYTLSMNATDLSAVLTLDENLHLISGLIEKPQHIEMTTGFTQGPDGLALSTSSVNTNHMGIASFAYTYQTVDGFQIPAIVSVSSEQHLTWTYNLTDCKTTHGQVVSVKQLP